MYHLVAMFAFLHIMGVKKRHKRSDERLAYSVVYAEYCQFVLVVYESM